MSTPRNWAEALNINPETLATWSAQAPTGTPLLVWCLEQGHIQLETYFTWAQAEYEVPVLDARYFHDGLDSEFLAQERSHGNWYPWQFPVEKWEDVTVVACVEVPPKDEWGNYRFVLADPRAMREAWSAIASRKSEDQPPDAPPALETLDAPIGISTVQKPFKLELNLDGSMEAPSEAPKAEVFTEELPVEASIYIGKNPSSGEFTQATQIAPLTRSVAHTAALPVASTPAQVESAIKDLIANLGQRYRGSLILKCRDSHAKLKHWDQRLKISTDHPAMNMSLSNPTFLRIVAKTMLPYHGYLMDSSAHRDFFQALGLDNLPSCVTAIPIKNEGNLWGIVVAIGSEENQKMDALDFVQQQTDKLMATAGDEWIKAA